MALQRYQQGITQVKSEVLVCRKRASSTIRTEHTPEAAGAEAGRQFYLSFFLSNLEGTGI